MQRAAERRLGGAAVTVLDHRVQTLAAAALALGAAALVQLRPVAQPEREASSS